MNLRTGRIVDLRWTSVVETVLFLAVAAAVNGLISADRPGFRGVEPHPYWIIVLLISLRYRLPEALVCATLAAGAVVLYTILPGDTGYAFSAIRIFEDFRHPVLFVLVAGVISSFTQQLLERNAELSRQRQQDQQDIEDLRDANQARTVALKSLEGRIASEFTSILDLFSELSLTRRMRADQIRSRLLDVLSTYVHAESVSYYEVEGNDLRRSFAIGERAVGQVVRRADDIVLDEAIRKTEIAHLGHVPGAGDFERYEGSLLAGALRAADFRVLGVVAIESMPFVDYNPHTFKLFSTIVDWWGTVLEEQLRLEEQRQKSVFDDDLGLYNYPYFTDRLRQEFERASRFSLPMSLALVRIDDYDSIEPSSQGKLRGALAEILRENLTGLEMAARYHRDDTVAISLPITMAEDARERVSAAVEAIDLFRFAPYQDNDRLLTLNWCVVDYAIGMKNADELVQLAESDLGAGSDDG